jgi:hypothetical protein
MQQVMQTDTAVQLKEANDTRTLHEILIWW